MEPIGYRADSDSVLSFQNGTRGEFRSFFSYRPIRRPLEGLRLSESVEIRGSHVGMGFNPAALIVVGERLAQKSGSWSRFTPPSRFAYLFP